jgi:hypothetical protein
LRSGSQGRSARESEPQQDERDDRPPEYRD